jgi:hypothetical protein
MRQRTLTIVGGQFQRLVLHLAKEAIARSAARGLRVAGTDVCPGGRRPGPHPQSPLRRRPRPRRTFAPSSSGALPVRRASGWRSASRAETRSPRSTPTTDLRGHQRYGCARRWLPGPGVPERSERLPQRPHLGYRRIRQRRCFRGDLVGPPAHGGLPPGRCRARARGAGVLAIVVGYRRRLRISLLKNNEVAG